MYTDNDHFVLDGRFYLSTNVAFFEILEESTTRCTFCTRRELERVGSLMITVAIGDGAQTNRSQGYFLYLVNLLPEGFLHESTVDNI